MNERPDPHAEDQIEDALSRRLRQLAAETTPAPDFVAALEEQLRQQAARQTPQRFRFPHQFGQFRTRRWAIAALLLCGLLISYAVATPPARAGLWDWLYGFGLVREEQIARHSLQLQQTDVTPTAAAGLTVEQVQAEAPFPVRVPTHLPAALFFTGGFVMPTEVETVVTLAYHLRAAPAAGYSLDEPLLFVAISDGALPNRPLLAEGYQVPVRIGRRQGIYTHGNWQSQPAATTTQGQTGLLYWDSTQDVAWLTWQQDGLNYLLYAQGLGFEATEMTQIAASME